MVDCPVETNFVVDLTVVQAHRQPKLNTRVLPDRWIGAANLVVGVVGLSPALPASQETNRLPPLGPS